LPSFRFATALWAASVIFLSLTPTLPKTGGLFDDKIEHFSAYALLFLLAIMGWSKRFSSWQLVVSAILFGGLMEVLQSLVPGHSPEWLDLAANSTGAVLGWGAAWLLRRPFTDGARFFTATPPS
jgi:VanZ family protein